MRTVVCLCLGTHKQTNPTRVSEESSWHGAPCPGAQQGPWRLSFPHPTGTPHLGWYPGDPRDWTTGMC